MYISGGLALGAYFGCTEKEKFKKNEYDNQGKSPC